MRKSVQSTIDEPSTGAIMSVTYSRDGKWMAWGSAGGQVVLLDRKTGLSRVQGHKVAVSAVAISSDGKVMLSAAQDGSIKLWETSPEVDFAEVEGSDGANA